MTDVKIIGSAAQPDPPGTVMVICKCRTTPMQIEDDTYLARCRRCHSVVEVKGRRRPFVPRNAAEGAAPYHGVLQERSY